MKHASGIVRQSFFLFCIFFSTTVNSANWLLLQGTEPTAAAERAKVWGFVQGQYQKDFSSANDSGAFIPPKLIGPTLQSQSQFSVSRARIGVRGTGFPIDSRVNYLLLAELGNNGITAGEKARLTDASVTLSWIPFIRIRGGLFKYPGSEEGLQAVHVFDYINFTTVTNQLMQERFPNDDNFLKTDSGRGNTEAQFLGISPNGFTRPVGAFRDVGIQLFDSISIKNWEASYALMAGNGNGLNNGDNNSNITMYYYFSGERIFEGKGPRRKGIKFFGWYQSGKRSFDTDFTNSTQGTGYSSGVRQIEYFKRTRMGGGFKGLYKAYRLSAEYLRGEGMIFLGPHKESFDMNEPGAGSAGDGLLGKASGWYVEGGWRVLKTNFEIDLRYDRYTRLIDDPTEVKYSTITLGGQYFFNPKMRAALNYEIRSASSTGNVAALEDNFSGLGNRLSFQFTALY